MISQKTIEEIKSQANLVEIIGETVQLRRQGSSFVGLCPFHGEKTPSFHVRDGGKYYHCFGCGVSGTAISYVMETKGLSFPDAIEDLASRYSIKIEYEKGRGPEEKSVDKKIFYDCNRTAQKFFSASLDKAPKVVIDYLKSRELDPETLTAFGIGFAPNQWHSLVNFLKGKKIQEETLLALGLARRNQQGELYDAFRGRLIFPIWIDAKRIVGFGGRIIPGLLEDKRGDESPKYINSPENPIYHKSKTLFGLPQAMQAIRTNGMVYLVEGYMDVVSLHKHGVKNVLATCGTAVTEAHAKRLSQFCSRVTVLFDGDAAGRNAAARTFSVFVNSQIDLKILFLPQGEDPDSLARQFKVGVTQAIESLPSHTPLSCFIDSLLSRFSADSVRSLGAALKGQICEEVAKEVSKVQNAVERDELSKQAAFKLLVEPERFLEVLSRERRASSGAGLLTSTELEGADAADVEVGHSAGSQERRSIGELPRLDQDTLLAAMGYHADLSGDILRDATLIENLQPVTRGFIEGLYEIVSDGGKSREEKKAATKELLAWFGGSWFTHWRKAHEMAQDERVDLKKVLSECSRQARKIKLNQSVIEIDRLISQSSDENERLRLVNEKLAITRRVSQV